MAIESDRQGDDAEDRPESDDDGGIAQSIPNLGDGGTKWYRDRAGVAVIALYVLLTAGAVLVATGTLFDGVTTVPGSGSSGSGSSGSPVEVPGYVLLYAFAGGLAYAFTSVLTEFEKTVKEVIVTALRLPAAVLLATGVYLLAALLFDSSLNARLMAGAAFLVGLYVKLAVEGLGAVARRLYRSG